MRKPPRIWPRNFWRREDGTASIEFLFWFPFFMYVTYSGVDLGLMSYQHANLERALDETIRKVRLNQLPDGEDEWEHDMLKDLICKNTYMSDCSDRLALEMKSIDPRVGNQLNQTPYCVDTPEEIRDPDTIDFDRGTSNELMIIRACLVVEPVWGFTMMGDLAERNPDGVWQLHSSSVFVHEPFGGSSDTSSEETPTGGTGG